MPNWFRSSLSWIFCKIVVLKNLAQFTGNDLCWRYILIKMQVTRPETSLKADSSTGILLRILHIFQKLLCTEHLRMTALVDFFIPTKVLSIDFFFYFHFLLDFFPFIIDNCNYESFVRKGLKIKIFFTIIIQKLTGMLQRQFHRRNNLPMLNFEGCIICTILKT